MPDQGAKRRHSRSYVEDLQRRAGEKEQVININLYCVKVLGYITKIDLEGGIYVNKWVPLLSTDDNELQLQPKQRENTIPAQVPSVSRLFKFSSRT